MFFSYIQIVKIKEILITKLWRKKMSRIPSRRTFIKNALAGIGAFTIVPRFVLGGQGHILPSGQLTKAIIGVG